jgi:transcriptional regulator with XRE-family HTH domain
MRRLREARGWSREELAAEAGFPLITSGVRSIYRWETNETKRPRSPHYYEVVKLLTGVDEKMLGAINERLCRVEAALGIAS